MATTSNSLLLNFIKLGMRFEQICTMGCAAWGIMGVGGAVGDSARFQRVSLVGCGEWGGGCVCERREGRVGLSCCQPKP